MTLAFDRMALPFRTDFSLAGTRCFLSTNSHEILRHATPWQAAQRRADESSFHMEIIEDASLDSNVTTIPHFRGIRHLVFAILQPRSLINYDLLRRRVTGVLSSAAGRDSSFWNTQLLPITIGVLGTTIGVAPLHCACLDRNGEGLLVAGNSGAGKSTLTAALAQRGYAVVSDDWTYLSRTYSGLVAYGLSAPIKLLPDSVRYFAELQGCAPRKTMNGELAYEIDPVRVLRSTAKSSSHPTWILFLERTTTPGCRFIPCRKEHARQYFESSVERLPQELLLAGKSRSEIINRLTDCPCWFLRTGEAPHKTAEAIEQFLPEVQHGAG